MSLERLGPYRIERQLGRGGMGTVYAAVHGETNQRVALKVLAPLLASDEAFRQRFNAEIESLLKLRHPNIVEIYAYGEQNGQLFYAMELIESRNLFEEQQAGRRFTWQEVTRVGIDVCKALKHAHDHGVVHRDLKPANLMLDASGNVKLTDFGIAKLFGATHLTSDGGVLGTADYMSPEQAEGKAVGPRTDLYSLGGVLYSLLTGRPPFVGKSLPEVLHMLRFSEPTPVRRLAPDTPEELELIIAELLDKEPQHRVPTAVALGRRLEAMLRGLTQPAREGPTALPPAAHTTDTKLSTPDDPSDFLISEQVTRVSDPGATANTPAPDASSTSAFGSSLEPLIDPATSPGQPKTELGASALTSNSAGAAAEDARTREMRFTVVNDEERRRAGLHLEPEPDVSPAWPKIAAGMVLLVLLCLVIAFALTPSSPERAYAKLKGLANEDDMDRLLAAETEIEAFMERFPNDEHVPELQSIQEEIDLYRLQRRFERQARRSSTAEALSPAERAYLEATNLVAENPEEAVAKMRAIVEVYGTSAQASANTRKCLELARRQSARLEESIAKSSAQQLQALEGQLAEAERLRVDAPEQARRMWRGMIELYGKKPWAAAVVERARAALASPLESPAKPTPSL